MILHIHGGPHGMYNVGFNNAFQNYAANDYVVCVSRAITDALEGPGSQYDWEVVVFEDETR